MWGLSFYLFLLPIFQWITCPLSDKGLASLCFLGRLEDSAFAFKQIPENRDIVFCLIGIVFAVAFLHVFGISVTKYASSVHRSTIHTARVVFVWAFSVAFLGEEFQPMQIPGFFCVVVGTLIYNEIFELPCWNFNTWTKRAIQEREEKKVPKVRSLPPIYLLSEEIARIHSLNTPL